MKSQTILFGFFIVFSLTKPRYQDPSLIIEEYICCGSD